MEAGILFILSILIHVACPGREFVVVDQSLDWTQAQTYCRDKYTDLVTVHNERVNQKLMAVAENEYDCIWIGLRHKLHTWRWSMGVPRLSYDEKDDIWADGEPDNHNGEQNCAVIKATGGGVRDRRCTDRYYFICFRGNASEKYILVQQFKTWKEAQDYCRTHHDDLASVTSEAVRVDLQAKLAATNLSSAWTGLYRDPWSTWSDSTNTSFHNWGTEPTIYLTDDHCGCLKPDTGKWEERNCTAGHTFFCYGDIDRQRQTILRVKLQSGADLTNKEIQHQIVEQIQNRLGSGVANVTVKWRATTKISETNKTVQIKRDH